MKKQEQYRTARKDYCQKIFTSRALFIAGLVMMPALLFNPVPLLRACQFLLFWLFAWLAGKKTSPVITLLIILFIIAFNLLVPYGRIIYTLGAFKITSGALTAGIQRAVTLEGLIMLSRAFIRHDLRLPGAFGELVGESFRFFGHITGRKGIINRKDIIGSIDALMLELSEDAAASEAASSEAASSEDASSSPDAAALSADSAVLAPARTTAWGIVLLVICAILAWLPWGMAIFLNN